MAEDRSPQRAGWRTRGPEIPRSPAAEPSAQEVFREAPVAVEPSEGALDHPSPGQHLEALGLIGSFDDLDFPLADELERALELLARITAIGEHVP
jgi:hypothetical protein